MVVAAVVIGVMGGQVVGAAGVTSPPGQVPLSVSPAVHAATPAPAAPGLGPEQRAAPPPAAQVSLGVTPKGPPAFVPGPTTESQVAQDLIAAIDAQSKGAWAIAATADNLSLVESWMANEGGLWADNPLNTSLDAGRYPHQITTGGQDTGIPIFPGIALGVEATATTLLSNGAYAGILAVLGQGDAPCDAFARAVIDSPWAASHYGHDPARFCGSSGGTVPLVTACLRLPHHAKGFALRAAREPGACGRVVTHTARMDARAGTVHRAAILRTPSHRRGVRYNGSHERADAPSATTRKPRPSAHAAPPTGAVRATRHLARLGTRR